MVSLHTVLYTLLNTCLSVLERAHVHIPFKLPSIVDFVKYTITNVMPRPHLRSPCSLNLDLKFRVNRLIMMVTDQSTAQPGGDEVGTISMWFKY